jgi:hypothetical protein
MNDMAGELGIKNEQYQDDQYFTPDVFVKKPVDKQLLMDIIGQAVEKAKKRKKCPK